MVNMTSEQKIIQMLDRGWALTFTRISGNDTWDVIGARTVLDLGKGTNVCSRLGCDKDLLTALEKIEPYIAQKDLEYWAERLNKKENMTDAGRQKILSRIAEMSKLAAR